MIQILDSTQGEFGVVIDLGVGLGFEISLLFLKLTVCLIIGVCRRE